jgi:hypothetical protein
LLNRFDRRRFLRIGLCPLLPAAFTLALQDCNGGTDEHGAPAAIDPNANSRNQQYNDYIKSKTKNSLKQRKG